MNRLWSRKQVDEEREYRVTERLGLLIGDAMPTERDIELAGADARAWERAMQFGKATEDEKRGQMSLI